MNKEPLMTYEYCIAIAKQNTSDYYASLLLAHLNEKK